MGRGSLTPSSKQGSFLNPRLLASWEPVKAPVSHLWTHLPYTIRRKELTLKLCSFGNSILSISKPQLKLDFIFPFQFLKAISTPTVNWYQGYEVSHQLGLEYSFHPQLLRLVIGDCKLRGRRVYPKTSDHCFPVASHPFYGDQGPQLEVLRRPYTIHQRAAAEAAFHYAAPFWPMEDNCNFQSQFSGDGGFQQHIC